MGFVNTTQTFIIITPAFNEAAFIEKTIQSVITQVMLPEKWVIVDDGSSDDTALIVQRYSKRYPFIQYHRKERKEGQAYFASNVHAIMDGYSLICHGLFDFLAILDADIILPENYYDRILNFFFSDRKLGVASGIYENLIDGKLCRVISDRRSTPKAIQVFRRQVFEDIGGFLPLRHGGEDTISCVMARMKGWQTWSFPEIKVIHLRPTGTGEVNHILLAKFKKGVLDYYLGAHPLFFLLKSLRRIFLERPYFFSGVMMLCGYFLACLRHEKIDLPPHVIKFIRQEHIQRIIHLNKTSYIPAGNE
jgi:poly-beta-1,6-N-acetyl-D-glucosamine synthase